MKRFIGAMGLIIVVFTLAACAAREKTITVSAGNVVKPVLDVLNEQYRQKYGIEVKSYYLCMAMLLSNVMLTQEADVFFSSSEYYMDKAVAAKVVTKDSVYNAGLLVPVITTPKGNPKNITKLADFIKPGVILGFSDFENLATGRLSRQILISEGLWDKVQANIKYLAASPAKLQTVVALGHVDAALAVWSEALPFTEKCELIHLPENQLKYALSSCAITSYARHKDYAKLYIDFIASPESKKVFASLGFALPENVDITKIQKVN